MKDTIEVPVELVRKLHEWADEMRRDERLTPSQALALRVLHSLQSSDEIDGEE